MRARLTNVLPAAAALAAVAAILLGAVAACGGTGATSTAPSPAGPAAPATSAPPAGAKLAPGLYDLEDGTVQAVGTVEHRDLEGGFWAVVGGTEAEGDAGKVVAVIANGAEYEELFAQNEGLSFIIAGTRQEGASTRMAGPEITATSVSLAGEGGAAE